MVAPGLDWTDPLDWSPTPYARGEARTEGSNSCSISPSLSPSVLCLLCLAHYLGLFLSSRSYLMQCVRRVRITHSAPRLTHWHNPAASTPRHATPRHVAGTHARADALVITPGPAPSSLRALDNATTSLAAPSNRRTTHLPAKLSNNNAEHRDPSEQSRPISYCQFKRYHQPEKLFHAADWVKFSSHIYYCRVTKNFSQCRNYRGGWGEVQ